MAILALLVDLPFAGEMKSVLKMSWDHGITLDLLMLGSTVVDPRNAT